MDLTADLLRAYRATSYTAIVGLNSVTFKIGEPAPALDSLLAQRGIRTAGFITAWNPLSERRPVGENKLAQENLKRAIEDLGLDHFEGAGREDGEASSWQEPSLLVLGVKIDQLIALASEFRQHASVWIEQGRAPELIPTPIQQPIERNAP